MFCTPPELCTESWPGGQTACKQGQHCPLSCQFISGLQTCCFVSWKRENGHLSWRRLHASTIKLLNPRDNDNDCSRSLTQRWHESQTQMLISCFTMGSNAGVVLHVFCFAFSTFSHSLLGPRDWWHPTWHESYPMIKASLSERALICHNCHWILSNLFFFLKLWNLLSLPFFMVLDFVVHHGLWLGMFSSLWICLY